MTEDYTRITEFKHLTGQVVPGKTTIMKEYSQAFTPGPRRRRPTTPSSTTQNNALYAQATATAWPRAASTSTPLGRAGRVPLFYNMDGVVASALDLSDELIAQHS